VFGFVVDNISTALVTLAFTTILVTRRFGADATEEDFDAIAASPEFLIGFFVLGTACTVLGGFVAGSRAGREHVRHGAWVGIVNIVLGLVLLAIPQPDSEMPGWLDALGFVVVVPAAALGGYLALRRDMLVGALRSPASRTPGDGPGP
jgi:hypothetical protein